MSTNHVILLATGVGYASYYIGVFLGFRCGRESVWRQEQDWWKNNQ